MDIQFIGMKEFRQNMSSYADQALKKKQQIIIMRKNKPMFSLNPIEQSQKGYTKFLRDIAESRAQAERGETYTSEEARKMLGL